MDVLFENYHGLGLITLNRPKALNALNHTMFLVIENQLIEWEKSSDIKAVVIRAAEGRAFCAGGDIRAAYELKLKNDPALVKFFADEYRLNRHIYYYKKPYIALMDGMTMGGGAGVSVHGSHRVATERLMFAMPETGIGFYPDVGGSYFLSRLPFQYGYYLGLTGNRISYHECIALGLTQHVVKPQDLTHIIDALANAPLNNNQEITNILNSFSQKIALDLPHRDAIEKHFAKKTVEDILKSLEMEKSIWSQEIAANLHTKSPTSLKVTLRSIQQGEQFSFDQCMEMEFRVTSYFLQGHDFFEGIRAAIIDKDKKPRWKPARLEEVTLEEIARYFSPLEKEPV